MSGIARLLTPRLAAERLTVDHFPEIASLHRDVEVMRTLSADGRPLQDDVTRAGLAREAAHWERHGFGLWLFRSRRDGTFIGRAGLKQYELPGGPRIALAYAVLSRHWNQGFATEMAHASLRVGFEYLGLPELFSWTLPHNEPSRRVLARLGFRREGELMFAALPHLFYRLAREEWEASRAPAE